MADELNDMAEYMRASILAHAPVNIDAWDISRLRAVYHVTHGAPVPYDHWRAKMSGQRTVEQAPVAASPEPTPAEMAAANDDFIKQIPGLQMEGALIDVVPAAQVIPAAEIAPTTPQASVETEPVKPLPPEENPDTRN